MEKKYQIFISSTYTDLIEERKRVRDTILSMLHFPVGMEIFGAADEEQWDIIRNTTSMFLPTISSSQQEVQRLCSFHS